jgi:ribonuclease R
MNKGASIYTSTNTIHMLPPDLSTNLISLNDKTTRLSKTIQIDYDSEMNVINTNIYESKFYNRKRFDYSTF